MRTDSTTEPVDSAALARKARFGTLPAPIPFESMIEERLAHPRNPAGDEYYTANCWRDAACVALDGF